MKNFTWFILLAIIAISCLDEPDCYQLNNSEIKVAFKVLGFDNDVLGVLDIRVPGTDSIFYPSTVGSSFALPLNPSAKEQEFEFRWADGTQDALVIGYSSQIQFVSSKCGQRYVFGDLKVLSSSFDSVRITSPTPTIPSSANIVIYRCGQPDLAGLKFKTSAGADSALSITKITADFPIAVDISSPQAAFYLPLNNQSNSTTFSFELEGGTVETVQLSYTRIIRDSPVQDCDQVTFFSRIKIASTSLDTISTKTNKTGSLSYTTTRDPATINFEIVL